MKIAICLHGYFEHSLDLNAGHKGYQYITKEIVSKCPYVDFFIHSWDVKNSSAMLNYYKPKKYIIEEQKLFAQELKQINQKRIDEGFDRSKTLYAKLSPFQTLSFSYSRKKAIVLKEEYEKENGFKYDCVVTCRFDLGQRSKGRNGYRSVSEIDFNPNYDMNYLYCAIFDQLNAGYPDQWYYSNSSNMDLLGTFYDKVISYFQENSEYEKALTTGWPDSNFFDNNSTTDPKQFTNEILKSEDQRSKNLMKYPRWMLINNHCMQKFFAIDVGLYKKTRFI